MSIACVIHFCTNDLRFLRKNVEEAKKISDCVVIPVCDHFFNGQPEDREKLNWVYREFPDCSFIEFEYNSQSTYTPFAYASTPVHRNWAACWHSTCRLIGNFYAPPSYEYILHLDADEILEGKRLRSWLDDGEYRKYLALWLGAYEYAHPTLRTEELFTSALLVNRNALDPFSMVDRNERWGIYIQIAEPKTQVIIPFVHHYSWVRSKSECVHKSKTWGHRDQADWKTWINRYFENKGDPDYMGKKMKWCETPCYFDPLSVEEQIEPVSETVFPNVRKVTRKEAVRYMLERSFATD